MFINFILLFFICFPFVQLIPNDSYNQPYYIFAAVFVFIGNFSLFGFKSKFPFQIGFIFQLTGIASYFMFCFPYSDVQDYKSLLTYISFYLIPLVTYFLCKHHKEYLIKFLKITIITWFVVGFVQTFIYQDFLNFLLGEFSSHSIIGGQGGRGVIGLAPEPTHYGFHIILLGIGLYTLFPNKLYLSLAFIQAFVFAKSASALLAIVLGFIFYLTFHKKLVSLIIAILCLIIYFSGGILFNLLDKFISEDSSRIISMVAFFFQNPTDLFLTDTSLNSRLGGLYVTFQVVFSDFFFPHSISHKTWTKFTIELLQKNQWLIVLSDSQSPSGIGSVLFQIGFLFFPYLIIFIKSIYKVITILRSNIFAYAVLFIGLSQYSLVSGDIGLVFGIFLYVSLEKKDKVNSESLVILAN
jgi:hypothetical protein